MISRKTNYPWAAHSPDLNLLDFFFWGYAKNDVYADKPRTLGELISGIARCFKAIIADMFKKVIENFAARRNECLNLEVDILSMYCE